MSKITVKELCARLLGCTLSNVDAIIDYVNEYDLDLFDAISAVESNGDELCPQSIMEYLMRERAEKLFTTTIQEIIDELEYVEMEENLTKEQEEILVDLRDNLDYVNRTNWLDYYVCVLNGDIYENVIEFDFTKIGEEINTYFAERLEENSNL